MVTEVSFINAKSLCVAAKKAEIKTGKSIETVLIDIIYRQEDIHATLEAIRLYYSVIFNSGLTMDDLDIESPAEVISLNRSTFDDECY